jgi:hypothetical protein
MFGKLLAFTLCVEATLRCSSTVSRPSLQLGQGFGEAQHH